MPLDHGEPARGERPATANDGGARRGVVEYKLFIPNSKLNDVTDWARGRMSPDVHGGGPFGDLYDVHSVYYDTADFDIFRQTEKSPDTKYRIRRYGVEKFLFLEEKRKTGGVVYKKRTRCDVESPERAPEARWFYDKLRELDLRPFCQIQYSRIARFGESDGAPIRLTIDREIRYAISGSDSYHTIDQYILELKYQKILPAIFKEVIAKFALDPSPFSKYRTAVRRSGAASRFGPDL